MAKIEQKKYLCRQLLNALCSFFESEIFSDMNYRFALFLLLAPLLFLSVSCDDLYDPVWGEVRYSERVAESLTTVDGIATERSEYHYAESKLVARIDFERYNSLWIESRRMLLTYEADWVLCEWQVADEGQWLTTEMSVSRFRDGRILEEVIYAPTASDLWIPETRWIYNYSGSRLMSWTGLRILSSGLEAPTHQGTLGYENGLLRSALLRSYSTGGILELSDQKELLCIDGRLVGYTHQRSNAQTLQTAGYRADYRYVGSLLSEMYFFLFNPQSGSWEFSPSVVAYYDYSQNGTLLGNGFESAQYDTYIEYVYERGSGNARFFSKSLEEDMLSYPTIRNSTARREIIPYAEKIFRSID